MPSPSAPRYPDSSPPDATEFNREPLCNAESIATGNPFSAAVALQRGVVTRYRLRTHFQRLFPGVYVAPIDGKVAPRALALVAGLWAPPDAVIAGWAAALLHGECWFSARETRHGIDLYSTDTLHCPPGIRLHRVSHPIPAIDRVHRCGVEVTSAARTGVDLGRWIANEDRSICVIDSLCRRSRTVPTELEKTARRLHGIGQSMRRIRLSDQRSDSPPESLLRLHIHRSKLPDPTPQLSISNEYGVPIATADLGYEEARIAIFYDGDWHRQREQ